MVERFPGRHVNCGKNADIIRTAFANVKKYGGRRAKLADLPALTRLLLVQASVRVKIELHVQSQIGGSCSIPSRIS